MRCARRDERLELWADDDTGEPVVWPRCPVAATYDDPHIAGALHIRRLKSLGFAVDHDTLSAWVIDVMAQLDSMEAEKLRAERESR